MNARVNAYRGIDIACEKGKKTPSLRDRWSNLHLHAHQQKSTPQHLGIAPD